MKMKSKISEDPMLFAQQQSYIENVKEEFILPDDGPQEIQIHCETDSFALSNPDEECGPVVVKTEPGTFQQPKQRTFCCTRCEFRSFSKTGLRKHIQRHFTSSAFQCKRCSYSVGSANRLARHIQQDHKKKSRIRRKSSWKILRPTTKQFTIPRVTHRFAAASERAPSSKPTERVANEFSEGRNPTGAEDQPLLRLDVELSPLKRKMLCEYEVPDFGVKTRSTGGSSSHEALASKKFLFCCDSGCDYSTPHDSGLNSHKKKHNWNEKFPCPRCSYSSKAQWGIDEHLARDHLDASIQATNQPNQPARDNPFNIDHDRESDDGILNQDHDDEDSSEEDYVKQPGVMATEANEGNLPSMEEVDNSWSLVYSEDSNDDEETLPSQQQQQGENVVRHCCDSCDYSTNKSDDLKRHKKKHSWNEKFGCPRCTYSAKQQCKVDQHLIRDHLEQQKSTEVNKIGLGREDCPSEEESDDLVLEDGDGELPAQEGAPSNMGLHCCDSCDYSNHNIVCLKSHMQMHNRNEAFRCPRCTYSAKRQDYVDLHLKKDHLDATMFRLMAQQSTSAKEKTGLADQEKSEIPSDTSGANSVNKRKRSIQKVTNLEEIDDPSWSVAGYIGEDRPRGVLPRAVKTKIAKQPMHQNENEIIVEKRKDSLADYFTKEKEEIAVKKKLALEQKEAAKATLRDLLFKAYELEEALESPDCTEEARKAHTDAKKMVDLFKATVKRCDAEIRALEEEDEALKAINN